MASSSLTPVDTFCASCPGKEIKLGLLLISSLDNAIRAKDSECSPLVCAAAHLQCLRERLERQDCSHYGWRTPLRQGDGAGHGPVWGKRRLYFPLFGQ